MATRSWSLPLQAANKKLFMEIGLLIPVGRSEAITGVSMLHASLSTVDHNHFIVQ